MRKQGMVDQGPWLMGSGRHTFKMYGANDQKLREGIGGSGSKCDRLAGSNQCSGSSCNAALFICEFFNLRLKGAVIAERLVKQRLDGDSPAMGSAQSAILLQ